MQRTIKQYIIRRLRYALGVETLDYQLQQLMYSQNTVHSASQTLPLAIAWKPMLEELINSARPGSVFSCTINNEPMLAPPEVLGMFGHCLWPQPEEKLYYLVETNQCKWLVSKVNPGDTVMEIGASVGEITIPLARKVGKKGKVFAFEPARHTQEVLYRMLELNNADSAEVVPMAISDSRGTAEFVEYQSNEELAWAADTSTLLADKNLKSHWQHSTYTVETITIDAFVHEKQIVPKAMKIDIEGFELYALQGAKETLEQYHPFLCIDIHTDVKTGESALVGVKPLLEQAGYSVVTEGHALYATPS